VFYKDGRDAKPIVIFVHGFKGFKDWGAHNIMARYFSEKRFVFIKFNFSHNGTTSAEPLEFADLESFGKNNSAKKWMTWEVCIDWIGDTPLVPAYQKTWVKFIYRHSRGGGISILKAAEDKRI